MLHLWVLMKCVCAFTSFELVFSGNLGQSQNCEHRSDPMQQSLIGAKGAGPGAQMLSRTPYGVLMVLLT